jgi:hypothetical protein
MGNFLSKKRQDEHDDYDEPDEIDDAIHKNEPPRSTTWLTGAFVWHQDPQTIDALACIMGSALPP